MKKIYKITIVLTIAGLLLSNITAFASHTANNQKSSDIQSYIIVEQQNTPGEYGKLPSTNIDVFHPLQNHPKGYPVFTGTDHQIHPAIERSESGMLLAGYYDTSIENCTWASSTDNGNTWDIAFSDNMSYDYISLKCWGGERVFATAVPNAIPFFGSGGMVLLAEFPDIHDPMNLIPYGWTWNVTTPEYNYGFHNMTDADIACDNSQNDSEYGLITAVMSKTNNEHDLTNIPFMQWADPDEFPMVWGQWWTDHENCAHTDCAIDPIKIGNYQWMYGVYDWYDDDTNLWKLFLVHKDYENLILGATTTITGSGNLQCPAITAYDHHVLILAETDENSNQDIICYYSDDGWNNFQSSFVTLNAADEISPDIRHVKNLEFVCTFVRGNTLYMSTTDDGGATWGTPEVIETDVIDEYKTSDLSTDAVHSLYEVNNSVDCDIWMTTHKEQMEAPTWEVGDSWTYETHIYIAASPNITDDMVLDSYGDLIVEVIDDADDIYTLKETIKPFTGTIEVPGTIGFKLTRFNSYEGTLKIQKSNLSLIEHEFKIKAIVLLKLGPITLPIPIQMQHQVLTKFEPMWNVLPFPLHDGKSGDYKHITLNEVSETSMFWGLIPIGSTNSTEGWVGGSPYDCSLESVSVPAGTYDAYNVSCDLILEGDIFDWYRSYYCSDIGNVVKCAYDIDAPTGNTYFLIEMELLSTTYSP